MKKLASLMLSLLLLSGTAFADSPKDSPKEADAPPAKSASPSKAPEAKTSAEISTQIEELRQTLQAQQEQLQLLKEELAKRDRQIEEARETAASANARATDASVKASEAASTSAAAMTTTSALNSTVANMAASNAVVNGTASAATGQGTNTDEKGPTTIRYKGVNITPGGFLAAETVNRTHATSADINTPLNSIPYNGNSLSKVSEMNLTGRQSRLSLLVDSTVGDTKVGGYYEADFLGVGTASNNRESNSYVFRQRQLFAFANFADGFSVSGGQMWSLASEDKKGIINRQEALPMVIDPQYVVGFTWQRAYGFRVVKSFEDKVSIGLSAEGPQATIGGRGFSTYTNTSATGAVTTFQNFWVDAPGSSPGLYNAFDSTGYSVNQIPDFIVKLALDPGFGHYEVLGIMGNLRDRIYPCAVVGTTANNAATTPPTPTKSIPCYANGSVTPAATGAYNNSTFVGGFGGSATVPLLPKKLDVGLKVVAGDGIGRYGSAQIQDATARPDGSLAPIKNLQALARLEWHPTPKWDIYSYWGGEYSARAAYTGYSTVTIKNTPAIPASGLQPSYPATSITAISTSGAGGFGSPHANNSGCATEVAPAGTGAPGSGGACAGDTHNINEFTLGFWNRLYSGEKGRVQWGLQYSYLYKQGWSGNNTSPSAATQPPGIAPKASDNMFFTSFRYYLP